MSSQPSALQRLAQQRIQRAREASAAPAAPLAPSPDRPPTDGMARLTLQASDPSGLPGNRAHHSRAKGRGKARPLEHMFRSADELSYDVEDSELIPDPAVDSPVTATMDTTHRHRGSPVGTSGAKRAQGTAGLNGGGRAKLAKHNLSRLAPKHLQSAALAAPVPAAACLPPQEDVGMPDEPLPCSTSADADEEESPSVTNMSTGDAAASSHTQDAASTSVPTTAKKSKLQELAALRLAKKASNSPSSPSSPSLAASARPPAEVSSTLAPSTATLSATVPEPPKSKLAAKIAAIKAAKAGGGSVPPEAAASSPAVDSELADEAPVYAPSGLPLASLFPVATQARAGGGAGAGGTLVASVPDGWRRHTHSPPLLPGGSPFDAWPASDARWTAFVGPSPDDRVMIARAGTRLAG